MVGLAPVLRAAAGTATTGAGTGRDCARVHEQRMVSPMGCENGARR